MLPIKSDEPNKNLPDFWKMGVPPKHKAILMNVVPSGLAYQRILKLLSTKMWNFLIFTKNTEQH